MRNMVLQDLKMPFKKYRKNEVTLHFNFFVFISKDIHKELENKISQFHKREDTILYISCFDANAGIFETLLTPEDYVLSDELNHASIIDGIRLSKAKKMRYKHRDMKGRYVLIVLYFCF